MVWRSLFRLLLEISGERVKKTERERRRRLPAHLHSCKFYKPCTNRARQTTPVSILFARHCASPEISSESNFVQTLQKSFG